MAPITMSCGGNKFCDGNGACKCRTQSSWNLLTNPGFDGSATSWTLSRSGYASVDVDSCSGSGSALIPGQGSIMQCLPAKPNQTYYVGYKFKSKSTNANVTGTAHCYVAFLPAGNTCSFGERTSSFDADVDYTSNAWTSAFAGGTSDSTAKNLIFGCSMVFDDVYYDQLSLSTILPSAPGF
jgi:hypothetical protein